MSKEKNKKETNAADADPEYMQYKCFECGATFRTSQKPAFCPNCGSGKHLGKPYHG